MNAAQPALPARPADLFWAFNRLALQGCGGVRGEEKCLPCYQGCDGVALEKDAYCSVCYTEPLGQAPTVRLECGHAFHYACVKRILDGRWNGPRMNFGFMGCPLCKVRKRGAEGCGVLCPRVPPCGCGVRGSVRLVVDGVCGRSVDRWFSLPAAFSLADC